jgi:hypothetical protein
MRKWNNKGPSESYLFRAWVLECPEHPVPEVGVKTEVVPTWWVVV